MEKLAVNVYDVNGVYTFYRGDKMLGEKLFLYQEIKVNIMWLIVIAIIFAILCFVTMMIYKKRIKKAHAKELQQITEKAEATRLAAEKAEHAKTDFLFQMSHDIRTPMNAIIGFTKFAKEVEDLETIKNEYIPKIETASNQLLMLINDVLEMSRIESGKMKFTRGDYDVISMLESVITVMEMQAEEKGLTVELNTNVKERYVYCDENHLNRVLMNLMSNAVKFTPSGGKITVSVEQKPDENLECASYEIKIADTGIGMSEEFIGKVFEPFERERTSTVSRMQGTGLGMAIVKSIVDAADDTITVESKLGEGTTFTLNAQFLLSKNTEERERDRINKIKPASSPHELKEYFSGKRNVLYNTLLEIYQS